MKPFGAILFLLLITSCYSDDNTDYRPQKDNHNRHNSEQEIPENETYDLGIIYLKTYCINGVQLTYDTIGKEITLPEKIEINDGLLTFYPQIIFSPKKIDQNEAENFLKHTFKYWNTKNDGSGEIFLPGSTVKIKDSPSIYYAISNEPLDNNNNNPPSHHTQDQIVDNKSVIDKENCALIKNGNIFPLNGKVKVVTSGGDVKVKVSANHYDIKIHPGEVCSRCGEIKLVQSGEDYTVQIVSTGEDLTTKLVGESNQGF